MNLHIAFSGGETSGLMTKLLLEQSRHLWDAVAVTFANTGEENDATLKFVDRCDRAFGFNVMWLEAVPHEGRVGTTHKIVSYETAARAGEPYAACAEKFGVANTTFPWCTRELKQRPMDSYLRSLGWEKGTFVTAIGIRADEMHRCSPTAAERGIIYPLAHTLPRTKPEVNLFWSQQPFRLELAGYQGNCKWCWKKSLRKLLTIADESPQYFNFPIRMEALYSKVGPEFEKPTAPVYAERKFFRGGLSGKDILHMAATVPFDRAENDAVVLPNGTRLPMDGDGGCSESCEVDGA